MSQVDAFIQIGKLKGESKDSKHKDWIDVLAWSWAMTNAGSGTKGGGHGTGKGTVQDFHFTKVVDTSSTDIAKQLLLGQHHDKATFEVRKVTGKEPLVYFKVEFEKVFVTSMSFGGSGEGGAFTESLAFSFKKYKATYRVQKDDGSGGDSSTYGYDVSENKEV